MAVSLDLRKAHRHHRHGDFLVVLTWVNDSRALVMFPYRRTEGVGWFIVDESASWRWNLNATDPGWRAEVLAHVDEQCRIACDLFGIEPTRQNKGRIANLVVDWIPELIAMPQAPDPTMSKATYGELNMFDNDAGTSAPMAGEEVRVEVNEGATYG